MTTASHLLTGQTVQKSCWRCGADFSCGAQYAAEKCWCDGLPAIQPAGDGSDCLCPACLNDEVLKQQRKPRSFPELVEGEDYYREGPAIVFTARYHLRRGSCCGSGCRHCPYKDQNGTVPFR